MSITYTLYRDDDPQRGAVYITTLSNTNHAEWQERVGLFRILRNRETGEEVFSTFNMTVWDGERVAFEIEFLDKLDELGGIEEGSTLDHLYNAALENGCCYVFV